jgi:CDP-4-dehydro-6-deoxyglucose reductase
MHEILTTHGKRFPATADEPILDAAQRAGIALEYSCRTGRCSTCKGRVRFGTTIALHDELGLSPDERGNGWILTCVRAAASNVELDIQDLGGVQLFAPRIVPCRIQSLNHLSKDVVKVLLRLPPTSDFRFHAGQYLDIASPTGVRRSYSIANAPITSKLVELHIRRVAGGAMSRYWFEQAKENDLLRLNGPLGTFFLRDIEDMEIVFLATGTGIAPVKAILEDLVANTHMSSPRSISVFWGGRTVDDVYWSPRDLGLDIQFSPVLSRESADWPGARGYVQHALLAQGRDMRRLAVYACGSELMIHDARSALIGAGLPEMRFHSDAFVCSSLAA